MTNAWEWWQNAIAGNVGPISADEPQQGYYRVQAKDGRWSPVAYWYVDGVLRCRKGTQDLDDLPARELWTWAWEHSITHEQYKRGLAGEWDDVNPAVMGHNAAPPEDSLAALRERIEDLAREAIRMLGKGAAATEAECDQASDLANTFGELEGKADKLRSSEKEPHLIAGREVDAKWKPLIERAADLKRKLKGAIVTPFLRKKEEETRAAQVAAIAKGVEPQELPEARFTAGSMKRSTALRTQKRAEVTDYAALIEHLKGHPEIKETATRIANAAARAGIAMPGCKVIETKVAA